MTTALYFTAHGERIEVSLLPRVGLGQMHPVIESYAGEVLIATLVDTDADRAWFDAQIAASMAA